MILKSRYVVPVSAPVIENGAIEISNGKIVCLGQAASIGRRADVDYGDAVICPAFVNAHTHLELSLLGDRIPPGMGFVPWLGQLVDELKTHPPTTQLIHSAVLKGVSESLKYGVTTIGDIARHAAWVREALALCAARVISFGEVIAIGTSRSLLEKRMGAALQAPPMSGDSRNANAAWPAIGINPHSPYTVEPNALRTCAAHARLASLPLAIHVAESQDELAFTLRGDGPLLEHLRRVGVWDDQIPCSGCRPIELLARCEVLGTRTLLIHANYVNEDDITSVASSGSHVVFCPRTHAAFGHTGHPFESMLRAGINVCVGTDSLASNPSLSILDELRDVARMYPDVTKELVLEMGTLRGAVAMGVENCVGSLALGKTADIAVIPLEAHSPCNAWTKIFETANQPSAVYTNGMQLSGA